MAGHRVERQEVIHGGRSLVRLWREQPGERHVTASARRRRHNRARTTRGPPPKKKKLKNRAGRKVREEENVEKNGYSQKSLCRENGWCGGEGEGVCVCVCVCVCAVSRALSTPFLKTGCKLPDSVRTLPEGSAPLVAPRGTSEVG